jgi:hypothetical protein
MRKIGCFLALAFLLCLTASAQDAPKAEAFLGYSYLRANPATSGVPGFNLNGGSGSIAFNLWNSLGIVGDFGGYHIGNIGGSGVDATLYTYLFGPRFSYRAHERVTPFAQARFGGPRARAFFAGMAAHSMLRLEQPATAAFGLVLALFGHAVGWPLPRGGSQRIVDALAAHLAALGGEIRTGVRVSALAQVKDTAAVLLDVTPRQFLAIAGDAVPPRFRRQLGRYRYGPGVFKVDWALAGPVPWTAEPCHAAATPTSAARSRRSQPASARSRPNGTPRVLTSSSPSRVASTQPAPPPVSRLSGRIATFRPVRSST